MDQTIEDRRGHLRWAVYGLRALKQAIQEIELGNPAAYVEAYRHAYGAEINLRDAGFQEIPKLLEAMREQLKRDMVARMSESPSIANIMALATANPRFRESLHRQMRVAYPEDFLRSVSGRKFTHPKTRNEVQFNSLPPETQRAEYQKWISGRQQPGAQVQQPQKAPAAPVQPAVQQQPAAPNQPGQQPGVQLQQAPAMVGAPAPAAPVQQAQPAPAPVPQKQPAAPTQPAQSTGPAEKAPSQSPKMMKKQIQKGLSGLRELFGPKNKQQASPQEKKSEMPIDHFSALNEILGFLEMAAADPDARTDFIRDMHTAADKWKKLPKGWTDKSRKKFWDTLTGDDKHKVTECIKKMEGTSISDPGAFCGALADRVLGKGWRKEQVKEMLKTKRERGEIGPAKKKALLEDLDKIAASLQQPLRTRRDYGANEEEEDQEKTAANQMALTTQIPAEYQGTTSNPTATEAHREPKEDRKGKGEHEEAEERAKKQKHSLMPGDGSSREQTEVQGKQASEWLTYDEVTSLCPSCGERMRKAGFGKIHASVLRRLMGR